MNGPVVGVDHDPGKGAGEWTVRVWFTFPPSLASPGLLHAVVDLMKHVLAGAPHLEPLAIGLNHDAVAGRVELKWTFEGPASQALDLMPWQHSVRGVMLLLLAQLVQSGLYLTSDEVAYARRSYQLKSKRPIPIETWILAVETLKQNHVPLPDPPLTWTPDEEAWLAAHPTTEDREAAEALRRLGELVATRNERGSSSSMQV